MDPHPAPPAPATGTAPDFTGLADKTLVGLDAYLTERAADEAVRLEGTRTLLALVRAERDRRRAAEPSTYPDPDAIGTQLLDEMIGSYMAGHASELSFGGSRNARCAHRRGITAALRHAGCHMPVTAAMVDAAAEQRDTGASLRAALAAVLTDAGPAMTADHPRGGEGGQS